MGFGPKNLTHFGLVRGTHKLKNIYVILILIYEHCKKLYLLYNQLIKLPCINKFVRIYLYVVIVTINFVNMKYLVN